MYSGTRRLNGRRLIAVTAVALVGLGLGACSSAGGSTSGGTSPAGSTELRLGYFPNLTHAAAIAGVEKGYFTQALGSSATLKTTSFNAGPAATEALFANAIDATFIGPNPTINAYAKSKGAAIRVISGATGVAPSSSSGQASAPPQTSRARRSRHPSWATPRTSRCATGCSSRA